jgi:hypothetical protein
MSSDKFNFCTLFDTRYMARGLALYNSLERTCKSYHLYIFAFDENCEHYLKEKNLINATIIGLSQFEDNELLEIKSQRSFAEYCWTCTPSTILFCLNNYKIDSCTYLDADLYFFDTPSILFDEINGSSIGITKHNYYFLYDQSSSSGEYCVQFMYFRNDTEGIKALKWWRGKCIDWCFNYLEDGRFGDQGYLKEMLLLFSDVHVIVNEGAGMAPWNILKYKMLDPRGNQFMIKTTHQKINPVFYHFHYLRYAQRNSRYYVNPGKVFFTRGVLQSLYIPYLNEIIRNEIGFSEAKLPGDKAPVIVFENTSFLIKVFVVFKVFLKRSAILRKYFVEKRKKSK